MKQIFTIFLFLSFFFSAYGQSEVDSLESLLLNATGEDKVRIETELCKAYWRVSLEKSRAYGKKAIEQAQVQGLKWLESRAYNSYGVALEYSGEPEQALKNYQKALKIAQKEDFYELEAISHNNIGMAQQNMGNFAEALQSFRAGLEVAKEKDLSVHIAGSYNYLGVCYYYLGEYEKSVENYLLALDNYQKIKQDEGTANILNNIGIVYAEMNAPDKALEYYDSAYAMYQKRSDSSGMAAIWLNSSEMLTQGEEYEQALGALKQALRFYEQTEDFSGVYEAQSMIAQIYKEQDHTGKALDFYRVALKNATKAGTLFDIAIAKRNLGEIFLEAGTPDSAFFYLQLSLKTANQIKAKEPMAKAHKALSEVHARQNNFREAYAHVAKYAELRDSIFSEESQNKIAELHRNYEIQAKEAENQLLRKENEQKQLLLGFLVLVSLLVVGLAFVLYKRYQIKTRANHELTEKNQEVNEHKEELLQVLENLSHQEQELRELNQTKNKIFSVIGHDLRAPIGSINAIVAAVIEDFDDFSESDEIKAILGEVKKTANSTYSLLENLLMWAKSQSGEVNFAPEKVSINEIVGDNIVLLMGTAKRKNIKFHAHIKSEICAFADKNMVQTIVRNLLSNAIKFTPQGGEVKISATKKGSFVEIAISDTGIGISPENIEKLFDKNQYFSTFGTQKEKGSGLGLKLCKDFTEINGGTISIKSQPGKGSTFSFSLPQNCPEKQKQTTQR